VPVEQAQEMPTPTGPVVGVDLGVKTLATCSDGTVIPHPRHLKRRLKKLQRLHKAVTRKQKGSTNRTKAARTLAKHSRRVGHQRATTVHQVPTRLTKPKSVIVREDLTVPGRLTNHHLAQALADVGFAEFKRHLLDKAPW